MVDTSGEGCQKCGRETDPNEILIPVEIPVSQEAWDLCEGCVDDFVCWIESGGGQDG